MILPNKSCIKLTHLPTGIIVICNSRRSQHHNREAAYERLESLLYAQDHDILPSTEVIVHYEFPDSVEFPKELDEYRKDTEKE